MISDVIEGMDGWLFLRDGTNRASDKLSGKWLLTDAQLHDWATELELRKMHSLKWNYKYKYIIIPDKQCVYNEYLPQDIIISDIRPAMQLAARFPDIITYFLPFLKPEASKELYYKTDTHWNHLDAVIALNEFFQNHIIEKYKIDYKITTETIIGDLGKKYKPSRHSQSNGIKINCNHQIIYDSMILNSGRIIITETKKTSLPTAVVFGDSMFTNIIPILSQYFRKLYYFHASVFDYDIIEEIKPDVVLNENVERFIGFVNKSSFRDIFMSKLLQITFSNKDQFNKIGNLPQLDLGLNKELIENYIQNAKAAKTVIDFENNRMKFINDNNFIYELPKKEREATGKGWEGNKKTMFCGWGAGYYHDTDTLPIGFAVTLNNLGENNNFWIKIYEIENNNPSYDISKLQLIYARNYSPASLRIYAERQEVMFPLKNLNLKMAKSYLFTVEGSGFLGCASSLSDQHPENYLFRGYFKFKNKPVYNSIVGNQSIAYRFIFPSLRFMPDLPSGIASV